MPSWWSAKPPRPNSVRIVRAAPDRVDAALERLLDLALAWESDQGLRPLSGVADGLTGGPARGVSGLRPVSADRPAPGRVEALLEELSEPARALLEHVADNGGEATTGSARHTVLPEDAATPAEELLARRLLVPRGGGVVVLPGEVGIALRGGRTTQDPVDDLPEVVTSDREPGMVDRAAAGTAFEAVRRVELLLDQWGTHPPGALRSGGLGVRDLRATAAALHLDEPTAALVVETAHAAGLLATGSDSDGNPVWIPTDAFDAWVTRSVAQRWVALVRAWLESPRMPGLVGSRDSAGKAWNALAPELAATTQVESRRMTLEVLSGLPLGRVLATGTGLPSLVQHVAWLRPRRPRTRADQVAWAVTESAALGVTALGGLASYARSLLAGEVTAATDELAALMPQPVDHVLIQADLTAVAPGPLESPLARTLQLLADVESRGGATVYRFTPASVRRALDTGWSAVEIHDFLGQVSRTPVPQPLAYLVDDTARTFGTVRVGHAEAFLRADDEAALTELLHHPQAASLGLRRIAPTVLICSTPLDVLLPRLRDLGAAPVVEAADGTVRVARPDLLRARTPKDRRGPAVRAAHQTAAAGPGRPRGALRRPGGHHTSARPERHAHPERLAGRAARGGRGRDDGPDRLRRQPRRQLGADRRPAQGRGRLADGARPPQRRRTKLCGPPDHGGQTGGAPSVDWGRGLPQVRRAGGRSPQHGDQRRGRARGASRRARVAARAVHRPRLHAAAEVPARAAPGLRGRRGR